MTQKNKDDKKEQGPSLEELQKKADEYLAGWQRARADYDNFEKQVRKEKAELIKNANIGLIISLLPVLDNLEKADEHKPDLSGYREEEQNKIEPWIAGVDNTYHQLMEVLKNIGLEKIDALGKEFDPATMEAIETRTAPEEDEGIVIEVVLSGYKLNGTVIRPARVIVNKK